MPSSATKPKKKPSRRVRVARPGPRPATPDLLAKRVRRLEAQIRALQSAAAVASNHEFLTEVTHGLRMPLSAMLLWVNLLTEQDETPPSVREGLEAIRHCVNEQMTLIEVLADVSRVVTGKFRLDPQPTDLEPMILSALVALQPVAKAAGVTLDAGGDGAVGVVRVDGRRFAQVVTNLVTNAIQFTPRGGRVTVRLRRNHADVVLDVTDNGEGIAAGLLPGIFNRLHRPARDPLETPSGGLGFGLAISRHLVELHGGSIAARSAGPGKGSTFVVRMPLPELDRKSFAKPGAAG